MDRKYKYDFSDLKVGFKRVLYDTTYKNTCEGISRWIKVSKFKGSFEIRVDKSCVEEDIIIVKRVL